MSTATRARQREMKQRLKAQLAARLAAQREVQREHPLFVAARERRRRQRQRRLLFALAASLLLLFLLRCEDDPPAPLEPPVVATSEPVVAPPPAAKQKRRAGVPRRPPEGSVEASARDEMAVAPTTTPRWLPQFRLQVSARSPRLAECFNGVERPGALRWSALVHGRSGRVTESVVEPVFRGVELDERQHECLVRGLTDPPFVLDEPDDDAPARRVSLIFEF